MRDPNRIPRIITLLQQLWLEYPDQRLGQLVMNYADKNRGDTLFHTEDDKIEENLKEALDQATKDDEDDEDEETSPRFTKGDIVEWTVMGSGGPGYVMGKIKCEVTHVSLGGTELVVRPLSWADAWEVLEREYEFEDFLEDYKHGGLENVGADDCTLMRKSNIDVIDHGSHISIAFNVKEESRVLYRCVNNTLSRSLGLDNDRLVLEQIQSQLKELLTDVHPTTDS